MSDTFESLLPSNSTKLERDMEATTARIASVPVPLRDLWNPDTCPVELLPWLAWTLSIDGWKPYWPEAIKRERIRQAINIQRIKGTVKAVRDAVNSFGADIAFKEWFETVPKGTPHTFEVTLTMGASTPNNAAFQQDIVDEINRTKPLRSHFTLTAGISSEGGIGVAGGARLVAYRRIEMEEA